MHQVWFDDHRKYYYVATGTRPPPETEVTADLVDRRQLRNQLRCHSFTWYLTNILPDLYVPQPGVMYHGQLKNAYGSMCMRCNESCQQPTLEPCGYHDRSDTFSYIANNRSIVHAGSGLCLTSNFHGYVTLDECNAANDGIHKRISQVWNYDALSSSSNLRSASGSERQERDRTDYDAVARDLVQQSSDATDIDKPIGRLTVQQSSTSISRRCLAQVSSPNGRQVAGLLNCGAPTNSRRSDERFTYWIFTYQLDWTVLS